MDDLGNLKNEFLTEAREHLASAEDDILELENQGVDCEPDVINRLFRAMHSIKGGSAFLNMTAVMELAHALENVIDNIRKKKIIPSSPIADLLLQGVDKLKSLLNRPDEAAPADISRELSDIKQVLTSPVYQSSNGSRGGEPVPEKGEQETRQPDTQHFEPEPELHLPPAADTRAIPPVPVPPPGNTVVEKVSRKYIYKFEIDLIAECDKKGIPLEEFMKNCSLMGDILEIAFQPGQIGTLETMSDEHFVLNLTCRTVVDDPEILMEALALSPRELEKEAEEFVSLPGENSSPDVTVVDIPITTPPGPDSPPAHQETRKQDLPPSSPLPRQASAPPAPLPSRSSPLPPQPPLRQSAVKAGSPAMERKNASSTIRISLTLLDKLMDLASELVLVRNQNMQAVESGDLTRLLSIAKKLNIVTSGLQAGVLQTRMQPVDTIFSKFTRIVRDISRKLGKEVALEIQGKDVELDKNIIEALGDPLTHLIRNAVDHGIELPAERKASGKSENGKVLLGAYHKAGHVNIVIRDDGKGMNPDSLKAAAVTKGILSRQRAESLSAEDAFKLIFEPGFSTAGQVTDISGRGVGMDVVKTNLKQIGGIVNVYSREGQGTTFDIRLPLTLSIMQALIVLVDEICFAIPQFNIAEIVRLYGEDVYSCVKRVNEQEIFSLRGKLLPVIRLGKILKIKPTYADPRTREKHTDRRKKTVALEEELPPAQRRNSPENSLYILILNLGSFQYGLIIDQIFDTEEIVIKPLHEQLKRYRAYAGTTVLGDGRIAMILDVANLADLAMFNTGKLEQINKKEKSLVEDKQTVIIFNITGQETFAIHLFLIQHIEKLSYTDILVANNKEYFRFQDNIIRLIRLENALESVSANYLDDVYVIIIKGKRPIGILVSQIIDTTMIGSNVEFQDTARPGIIGVLMLDDVLTMLLDVYTIVNTVEPGWFTDMIKENEIPRKVLLLEDTRFYASLITSYLYGTGIEVIHGVNGREGVKLLEKYNFDLIISDLAMPLMDGFEFARYVRSHEKYRDLTLIAISSAYNQEGGKDTALEAGFNEYVSKLDREGMLDCFKKISSHGGRRVNE